MKLTQEELKQWLYYDPDTGLFTRIRVTRTQQHKLHTVAGSREVCGYITISLNSRIYKAHVLAFLYMTGQPPKGQVDHINRKRDDNRWENLRDVSKADNLRNQARSTRRAHGVYPVNNGGYAIRFTINKKDTYFGFRQDREKAIAFAEVVKKKLGLWEM